MEIPRGADGEEIRAFDLIELVEPHESHDCERSRGPSSSLVARVPCRLCLE